MCSGFELPGMRPRTFWLCFHVPLPALRRRDPAPGNLTDPENSSLKNTLFSVLGFGFPVCVRVFPPLSCSVSHFSPRECPVSRHLVTSRFLNVSSLSCPSESCGREAAVSPWGAGGRYVVLPSGAVFSHHWPQAGPRAPTPGWLKMKRGRGLCGSET